MLISLVIFCGLGAVTRYALSKLNGSSWFPVGTFLANIIGAFIIGLLYKHVDNKDLYAVLATGFCGGLTTFSTLNSELVSLFTQKKYFISYLLLTYLIGFLAIFLGIWI